MMRFPSLCFRCGNRGVGRLICLRSGSPGSSQVSQNANLSFLSACCTEQKAWQDDVCGIPSGLYLKYSFNSELGERLMAGSQVGGREGNTQLQPRATEVASICSLLGRCGRVWCCSVLLSLLLEDIFLPTLASPPDSLTVQQFRL